MSITEKILCSKSHEYLLDNENGTYTIGLTDYAVQQLGDIVFVELPEIGVEFKKGENFGAVESVKAASEIYMPITGTITAINDTVVDSPETVNAYVFDKGWLIKIEAKTSPKELADLMEYEDYKEEVGYFMKNFTAHTPEIRQSML